MSNRSNRLLAALRSILPNAVWDGIKNLGKWAWENPAQFIVIMGVIGAAIDTIINRLRGMPSDFLGVLAVFGMAVFVSLLVYVTGRLKDKREIKRELTQTDDAINMTTQAELAQRRRTELPTALIEASPAYVELQEKYVDVSTQLAGKKQQFKDLQRTKDAKAEELEQKLNAAQAQLKDTSWLQQIAAKQARNIQEYIDVKCDIQEHRLVGDNLYIDFLISFRSHCVYSLTLSDKIDGSINFDGRLTHAPVLARNGIKGLEMDETRYLELHQPLTGPEAAKILTWQGSFGFYGLTVYLSGTPGIEERPFDLPCGVSIDAGFINANYRKAYIQIGPLGLRNYFGRSERNGKEWPHGQLGTIVNLKVRLESFRRLRVHQFKLVTSGPIVFAERGEIRARPYRSVRGRRTQGGEELGLNLADQVIDIERNAPVEGWLQFIVEGVEPEMMLNPERFVARLHVVDESGEEHLADVVGLQLDA